MCTSFRLNVAGNAELQALIDEVCARHSAQGEAIQRPLFEADLHPDDEVLTIAREGEVAGPSLMRWGLPGFSGRNPIVNARSETAALKPLFAAALESRRCLVPATGFYEWDASRKRHLFTPVDGGVLYMAAIFSRYDGVPRCCVLTCAASPSVAEVHDRMPLIIPAEQRGLWLRDPSAYHGLLSVAAPALHHEPAPAAHLRVPEEQERLL